MKVNPQNKYLRLADGVYIHQTPVGAVICQRYKKGQNNKPVSITFVNTTARDLLLSCDGTKKGSEIITNLFLIKKEKYSGKTAEQNLLFLYKAYEKGHIDLFEAPLYEIFDHQITGTSDFFLPIQAAIELTYYCNFKCRHCYVESSSERTEYIDTNNLIKKMDYLWQEGIRVVELTGGEPTTHPDFHTIFKKTLDTFPLVALLTNGSIITDRTLEIMKKKRG